MYVNGNFVVRRTFGTIVLRANFVWVNRVGWADFLVRALIADHSNQIGLSDCDSVIRTYARYRLEIYTGHSRILLHSKLHHYKKIKTVHTENFYESRHTRVKMHPRFGYKLRNETGLCRSISFKTFGNAKSTYSDHRAVCVITLHMRQCEPQ